MRHVTLIVAVVALAFAAPAIADKGGNPNGGGGNGNGNGNGNGGGSTASAWVSASPNPAVSGTRVEVTGCGYDVTHPVELHIVHSAGYTEAYGVGVWNTGCMNPTPVTTAEAGTYTLEVYQQSGKATSLEATSSLVVG